MKVRMKAGISGGRGDGSPWPGVGGELEVDAEEGAALCRGRLAVPVAEPEPPAQTPEQPLEARTEERAAPKAPRPRAAKQG